VSDSKPVILVEPESPWFVNVVHFKHAGRPWCCSPVDYGRVEWSENWADVNCARCHRQRGEYDAAHG